MTWISSRLVWLLFPGLPCLVSAQTPISYDNGRLVYNHYANLGDTNKVNVVPDFSFAGYSGGGVQLPTVKKVITVEPKVGDCRALVQDAIDKVSQMPIGKNGFRGAVVLKKGVYEISGTLVIKTSGVILRGDGNGVDGTRLIATRKSQHSLIEVRGSGKGYGEIPGSRKKITSRIVPTGSRTIEVAGHPFSKGDAVVVAKTPNNIWIDTLHMAQYGWTGKDYRVYNERTVVDVIGDKIILNAPLVDPIEERFGGGEVSKSKVEGRIEQCGIENLRLESVYEKDEDENHAWIAVKLVRARDCWVKNVFAFYFGYACVSLEDISIFNTVEDCAMVDPKSITTGGRKYSFNLGRSCMGNLFQRCVSWGGRHDYVTGSRVPGPNVFLDCVAENTFSDIGPHHRWATGTLFDNIHGGDIRVQNRKAMGTGHGWAGAQTMFWNCVSSKEIKVESPPMAMNWSFGSSSVKQSGAGSWESFSKPVMPRSLYLQQLEERLGKNAVLNITTESQRMGTLLAELKVRVKKLATEKSSNEARKTINVSSLAELQRAIDSAKPGDTIVMRNGSYIASGNVIIKARAAADARITIQAETIGGVEIGGTGGFVLESSAAYIAISGFKFTHDASLARSAAGSRFCTWTHNIFQTKGNGESLTIAGNDQEVSYNTFADKNSMGRFLAIRGSGSQVAQRLWIHHNYFFNFPYQGGANGAEPFQFGLSGFSLSSSNSVVEYNLFENCYGENELISIKASLVTVRYNTIIDCPAQFTLRHGNKCQVYGNYFRNTPGIRIFGDDHIIHSNYFENCSIAIQVGNGGAEVADGAPLTSHDRPDRILIAFNTLVNNKLNILQSPRDNGLGSTFVSMSFNIIQGGGPAAELSGPNTESKWKGNIVFNTQGTGTMPASGLENLDPKLIQDSSGIYRISKNSPAKDRADDISPLITTDIDGQTRVLPFDVGADEFSKRQPAAFMLSKKDVGHEAIEQTSRR